MSVPDTADGLTVTVNWQCDRLLDASDPVQSTVVTPTGKLDPGAGRHDTVAPAQLSTTSGRSKETGIVDWPDGAVTVTFCGHVTVGAVASSTVSTGWHMKLFPAASVTVNVRTDCPNGSATPGAGT